MKRSTVTPTTSRWRGFAAAVLVLAACGGGGDSTATDAPASGAPDTTAAATTEPATTATDTPTTATDAATTEPSMPATTMVEAVDHLEFEFRGCVQFGTNTGISVEAAAPFVPADETVFVSAIGEARVALVTKTCEAMIVDGVDMGPGHFNTLWLRVVGPEDLRMVPDGDDELPAIPDHFVPLMLHSDNAAFVQAVRVVGVPIEMATIEADPTVAGTQTGSAVTTRNGEPLSYHWSVENIQELPEHLAVVHVLHGTDAAGRSLTYDIACVMDFGWSLNPATVEFDVPGDLAGLIGTGWSGNGFGPTLDCHVVIDRG